jgi:photosystem II stability/assembly factor-like uncharacterized protein
MITFPETCVLRMAGCTISQTSILMRNLLLAIVLMPLAVDSAEWINISDPVTAKLKPGYAGPTAGVTVDPSSGEVFMVINDLGLWKSIDRGGTFTRVDESRVGGRCETGWALQFDPEGRRLFCFMIYGSSAITTDSGSSWAKSASSHFDFGAVDWGDTGKRVLALRHESGGVLATSEDSGATWRNLEKGFSGLGVVDRKTFLATKAQEKGIFISDDTGVTWNRVATNSPAASVPVVFRGNIYWPAGKGILVSKDKGKKWEMIAHDIDASHGPYFGKQPLHFVIVGKSGFKETKDGGKTWTDAAPLPPGFGVGRVGPNYAWDPNGNVFYASTMTKPTFKFLR